MGLKIAFIGYDERCTRQAFEQFAHDNRDQVVQFLKICGVIRLKDGTRIERFTGIRPKGRRYDQIIIADDRRMNILATRAWELGELLKCSAGSVVPEMFRFCIYDMDAGKEETA